MKNNKVLSPDFNETASCAPVPDPAATVPAALPPPTVQTKMATESPTPAASAPEVAPPADDAPLGMPSQDPLYKTNPLRFAQNIALQICAAFYKPLLPNWRPSNDLGTVLFQINDMISGLEMRLRLDLVYDDTPAAAPAPAAPAPVLDPCEQRRQSRAQAARK